MAVCLVAAGTTIAGTEVMAAGAGMRVWWRWAWAWAWGVEMWGVTADEEAKGSNWQARVRETARKAKGMEWQ